METKELIAALLCEHPCNDVKISYIQDNKETRELRVYDVRYNADGTFEIIVSE